MTGIEKVVKHLEIIQSVINRLGSNSFLIKSWSMAIIAAVMILIARAGLQNPYFVLIFVAPVFGFWYLDGYFLQMERIFRAIYNDIRIQPDTNFEMDIDKHKPKYKLSDAIISITLIIFYIVEIVLIGGMSLIVYLSTVEAT